MPVVLRAAIAATVLFAALPAHAAVLVTVDKSIQQMTVAVDGRPLYQWPVSTGRAGYDTPSGKFKAFRMERDHFSKEFDDAPMPFSIFFTERGHAIHGSYDKRIGQPVSHGCVRLSPANAETLYKLVEQEGVLNTTVVLTGTIPSRAPAVARRAPPRPQYADPYAQQPRYYQDADGYYYYYPQPQPQYVAPQPSYAQRSYAQPYYGQPTYVVPRGYYYQDPYGQPAYRSRGSLFD
jgi:hypothetical protein